MKTLDGILFCGLAIALVSDIGISTPLDIQAAEIKQPEAKTPNLSECSIVRQEDDYPFIKVYQDCDDDGKHDRICVFMWDRFVQRFRFVRCEE